ncbi:hypothetical protein Mcup_1064 [Metallosphaera cuprina Ar-4]|uniref:Uncharacterized protein n=1 Tax=Metallosphaera cuprina (strain Ar-4) TaxID=1006006 RepID=F4G2X1_METCR|nr:hypothetical protein Mcup_1064 [Metallosphaera cuprina Ar-4]
MAPIDRTEVNGTTREMRTSATRVKPFIRSLILVKDRDL